ncbi:hypothetical protein RJ640_017666 [Escallonia rubra]|uniref:Ubiquitin-like protease family profile domain-containing protein n=1 Tax=Escallonia rubra TaxID=112253 RepID=A0AA88U614_9ASTE|nr:hypothetical protein RJ640_017666 [Escallonia rubra]
MASLASGAWLDNVQDWRDWVASRGRRTLAQWRPSANLQAYLARDSLVSASVTDVFLIPFLGNHHWYLVCYEPVEKVVSVIDSLHNDTPKMPMITMYKGLGQLDAMNLFCALVNSRRYERVPRRPKLLFRLKMRRPKQHNSADCGVFVCMYMDYIYRSESLGKTVWSRECIQGFRYRIA